MPSFPRRRESSAFDQGMAAKAKTVRKNREEREEKNLLFAHFVSFADKGVLLCIASLRRHPEVKALDSRLRGNDEKLVTRQ